MTFGSLGNRTLFANCSDGAGNVNSTSATAISVVDTTPPTFDFTPQNQTIEGGQAFTYDVNASDNFALGSYRISNNNFSINNNGTIRNATTLVVGTSLLNISVNDSSGNSRSTIISVIIQDTTSPTISIISPMNQTYGSAIILVNISTGDNVGVSRIWYNFNGTNITYTTSLNVNFSEGSHTIYAYANDSAGNVNSTLRVFYVNTSLPNIIVNSPINTSYNRDIVLIDIVSDGTLVWYNWNGTNITYNAAINVTFNQGSNNLKVYANNSLGLENLVVVNFFIDSIAPVLDIISPQNITSTNRTILVNISSNGSSIWYNLEGSNITYTGPIYYNFTNTSHTIYAYANDSIGNLNSTSLIFSVNYTDVDGDLIPDYEDHLIYNESAVIKSGLANLDIFVNGNTTIDGIGWPYTYRLEFYDSGDLFMNFTHNFTKNDFDLSRVHVEKTALSIVVNLSGQLASGEKKTLYLGDNSFVGLCVKDSEISSVSEISSSCNVANETDFTSCIGNAGGVTINGITCYDDGAKIRVENLSSSGIRGTQASPSAPVSIGGGGGGGCSTNWNCTSWSSCVNNKQTRVCTKLKAGCSAEDKPVENKTCVIAVVPLVVKTPANVTKGENVTKIEETPSAEIKVEKESHIWELAGLALLFAGLSLLVWFIFVPLFVFLIAVIKRRAVSEVELFFAEHKNRVGSLINKLVYTDDGNFFGIIENVIIHGNKISRLMIELDEEKKKEYGIRGVLLDYAGVESVGRDIVLIDKRVIDKLEPVKESEVEDEVLMLIKRKNPENSEEEEKDRPEDDPKKE